MASFLSDEGEEFVECGRLDRSGRRWGLVRQGVGLGRHPGGDGLMHHAEVPGNAAQVHPVDVELGGLAAEIVTVALRPWGGRVFAPAHAAQVALAARRGAPVLDLLRTALTMRTGAHAL